MSPKTVLKNPLTEITSCQLSPCARKMVEERGWEQYCGQELGCKFYMLSFVVDGCEYFSIDCHFADVLSSTWDCDGVEVVVVPEDCNGLGLDREARIVGVSK